MMLNKTQSLIKFQFFIFNGRSIRIKIDYIESVAHESSVICITETHLDENISNEDIFIPGYHEEILRNDRNCFGGGVLIYIYQMLLK